MAVLHVADFQEDDFIAMLDALPANAAVLDQHGNILAVNKSWARFHEENGGTDAHFLVGRNYLEACRTSIELGDDTALEAFKELEKLLQGAQSHLNFSYPCDSPYEHRWFRLVARQLEGSSAAQALVMHFDETAQFAAEQASRRSDARFRRVIEDNTDPVLIVSLNGAVLYANRKAAELFGRDEDALVGHVLGLPVVLDALTETTILRRDGATRICELRCTETHWESEAGYFVQARDVTDIRAQEGSRVMLAAAVDQAVEGIYITDAEGVIEYANPAFCRISGFSIQDLLGQTPRLWNSGVHTRDFYQRMWLTNKTRQVWTGEIQNNRKDGKVYVSRVSITPVVNSEEIITNYVSICQDITEEKKFEDRVRQSQKLEAIGTLAGGIAHDFNNILSAIFGYSELALDSLPEETHARNDLGQVLIAAGRARDLVQQILTFSRETEQEKHPIRIDILAKEVLKLIHAMLPSTIETEDRVWVPGAEVLGDGTQLHQVILNLCTNAFHAMRDKGGLLTVGLEEEMVNAEDHVVMPDLPAGPYYVLTVADTGVGMEPQVCDRIFEPFFTTKPKGQGTGLGLSTSMGIVRDLGGTIYAESRVGQGSTFKVYLPALPKTEGSDAPDFEQEWYRGQGERILIVDDEAGIADVLGRSLSKAGYEVDVHVQSRFALEAFSEAPHQYDAIITDQTMPRMTGLELATAVHALRPEIPVIIATGFSDLINAESLKAADVYTVVPKPLTMYELSRTLQILFQEQRESAQPPTAPETS